MSVTTIPCLVCGGEMERVEPTAEAQPDDGLMCHTYGNYGSTIFDPMNGENLTFIICDECMVKAGEQGRVLATRSKRPVLIDSVDCGWLAVHDAPYVPWHKGLAGYDDAIDLDSDRPDEIESFANDKRITWHVDPRAVAQSNRERRAAREVSR